MLKSTFLPLSILLQLIESKRKGKSCEGVHDVDPEKLNGGKDGSQDGSHFQRGHSGDEGDDGSDVDRDLEGSCERNR